MLLIEWNECDVLDELRKNNNNNNKKCLLTLEMLLMNSSRENAKARHIMSLLVSISQAEKMRRDRKHDH